MDWQWNRAVQTAWWICRWYLFVGGHDCDCASRQGHAGDQYHLLTLVPQPHKPVRPRWRGTIHLVWLPASLRPAPAHPVEWASIGALETSSARPLAKGQALQYHLIESSCPDRKRGQGMGWQTWVWLLQAGELAGNNAWGLYQCDICASMFAPILQWQCKGRCLRVAIQSKDKSMFEPVGARAWLALERH